MSAPKILVTGATGYIGGSVLLQLTNSKNEYFANASMSATVRGEERAQKLGTQGYDTVLFDDLDSFDQLKKIASTYDVIIQCTSGFHEMFAKALIEGLGIRRQNTRNDVHYIHTSGTTNFSDRPITGGYSESRVFSDSDKDLYNYLKMCNEKGPYDQRQTDLTVIETGRRTGVKTYIISSPTIYGVGTGHFNIKSIQIPSMITTAIENKQAEVIADGKGVWGHVHITDLVELYEIIAGKVLSGEILPSGEQGFYFSENGHHAWFDIAQGIADALVAEGVTQTAQVKSLSLEEAAKKWVGGDQGLAELGFASNSRTKGERSRSMGWKPRKDENDFHNQYRSEIAKILDKN